MKSYFLFLTFTFSFYIVKADGIKWVRACLDDFNNEINIQFRVNSNCDSVTTLVYGERIVGSGYTVIGSIDTAGLRTMKLDAKGSKDWNLYLVMFNKCTGDSIISSFLKVDNTPPQGTKIDSVSVVDEDVMIGWEPSTSNDLKYYVLYYDEPGGLGATLDTVKNNLFYLEQSDSVNASVRSETYRLAAFDSCDISTGPIDAHSTVFLNINKIDYCDRNLSITRNNYYGWDLDEIKYTLVYKPEGAVIWKKLADFDYNDLYLELATLKQNFDIKVRAVNTVNGFSSSSNSIRIFFGDERKLDSFYIYHVELDLSKGTKLGWFSNKTDLVQFFDLEYSENGRTNWNYVKRIDAKRGGIFTIDLDNKVIGRYYRIKAISACWENLGYSNSVRVQGLDFDLPTEKFDSFNKIIEEQRVVRWLSFKNWNSGSSNYEVSRYLNGVWQVIGNTQDTFFIDLENMHSIPVDSGICYRVKSIEQNPMFDNYIGESYTNVRCVFFDFHGALPTGFVALENGNNIFSIPVDNLDKANSYLKVYNRWGELVFDNGLEWNGGVNNDLNNLCPEGVYFYVGRIQLQNRKFYFISKSVLLIR